MTTKKKISILNKNYVRYAQNLDHSEKVKMDQDFIHWFAKEYLRLMSVSVCVSNITHNKKIPVYRKSQFHRGQGRASKIKKHSVQNSFVTQEVAKER